jgi:hypothetical protein
MGAKDAAIGWMKKHPKTTGAVGYGGLTATVAGAQKKDRYGNKLSKKDRVQNAAVAGGMGAVGGAILGHNVDAISKIMGEYGHGGVSHAQAARAKAKALAERVRTHAKNLKKLKKKGMDVVDGGHKPAHPMMPKKDSGQKPSLSVIKGGKSKTSSVMLDGFIEELFAIADALEGK